MPGRAADPGLRPSVSQRKPPVHRYWPSIMRPVCELVRPRTIVEVGAAAGINSRNVLEYCAENDVHVDIIDPVPFQETGRFAELLERHATVHQTTSHEALPALTGEVFLVDGDHNWFTVYHELKLIEEAHAKADRPQPVIFCHDVAWPYGRRDMYYEPARIPAESRQPYARRGIQRGRSELLPEGGFNYKHDNALTEGGPRNGVLTGVEDFLAESALGWELHTFPAFHGLAVLLDPASLEPDTLEALRSLLALPEPLRAQLEAVEEERTLVVAELVDVHRVLGGKPGPRLGRLVRALRRLRGR